MSDLRLLFYRRLTGQEVESVPSIADEMLQKIADKNILEALIISDLKSATIGIVAVRYRKKREYVRAIGRKAGKCK